MGKPKIMSDQAESGKPVDILLVEDNPGDVRLTKEAFKEAQISNTFHVVTDGVEALDFLYKRGSYTDAPDPDIILLDLNLPRKDGDEILDELTDDPALARIPVIILSSSQTEEDIARSYNLRANAYLTKPVDPEEFIETIRAFREFWLEIVRLPPDDS